MLRNETLWSETECLIAQTALKKAYHQEITTLIQLVQNQAQEITAIEQVWQLHDFLSARRHEIDGKYDDHPLMLTFVLANLYKQGWLSLQDLEGLTPDKIAKITALARM